MKSLNPKIWTPDSIVPGKVGGAERFFFRNQYNLEAVVKATGEVKWRATIQNLVVTEGLNAILETMFGTFPKPSAYYLGLIEGATAPVAGDTLASHGFTEYTGYTGDRKQWIVGPASAGSIATLNPASRAEFDFTETKDITGVLSTDQLSGNVGVLFAAAMLGVPQTLNNGWTLRVDYTVQATSA